MPKYEVRVSTEITFDFIIEAPNRNQARLRASNSYLKYIDGGKLDNQRLSCEVLPTDKLTNIFVMNTEVEDINEI